MNAGAQVTQPPQTDEGLRCLACAYNLTGLTSDRCPECGVEIDWAAVKRARDERLQSRIPWETWRGWRRGPAFLLTVLEVALLPWRFARRIPERPRLGWATAFLALCFAWQAGWYAWRAAPDIKHVLPYTTGAAAHVVLQTLLLTVLLPLPRVRLPLQFWCVVSCYTTYPLLVEAFTEGSPIVLVDDWNTGRLWSNLFPVGQGGIFQPGMHPILSALYYLWVADLVVIAWSRVRAPRWWRAALMLLLIGVITVVSSEIGLYAGHAVGAFP